ncbi:MAG: cadherin-like beta sandwich domain-containing protein [Clostridia bacterium]
MSKIKNLIIIGVLSILFLIIFNGKVNAASASISCESFATVGTPITISVSGSAVQWNLELKVNGTTIASDSELENYEANKTISFSGTYVPNEAGTLNISLTGTATEASDGSTVRSFSSKTITVKEKETTSSDNTSTGTGSSNNSSEQKSKLTAVTVDGTTYNNGDKIVVENDKTTVRILGVGESLYYIKVNGESSGIDVKLNEGTNSIVVYDNNGGEIKLSISRKAKEEETKPNVIEKVEEDENEEKVEEELALNTLEVVGLELEPKFSPNIYSYTINIDMESKDYSKLEVKATSNQEDAIIKIDGAEELVQGENVINIIVTSKDGSQIKTYQIIVNKIALSSEITDTTGKVETINEENNENKNKILIIVGCVGVLIVIVLTVGIVKKTRLKEDDETGNLYNYDLHIDKKNDVKNQDIDKIDNKENKTEKTDVEEKPKKDKKKRKGKGKHA